MCGRYRPTAKERWLSQYFQVPAEDLELAARWNIAPTDEIATNRQDRHEPKRKFAKMRWGLIPYWAKDISIGAKTIKAKSRGSLNYGLGFCRSLRSRWRLHMSNCVPIRLTILGNMTARIVRMGRHKRSFLNRRDR